MGSGCFDARPPRSCNGYPAAAMRALPTSLEGVLVLEPDVHGDERGFFVETYRAGVWGEVGVDADFVQDNHSRSRRGTLRGMHYQTAPGQAKLVRCARGAIYDVVVDVRRGSPTFGRWEGHELDDERLRQLWVPVGFAHGFCVLSEIADVTYKCSSYYDPATAAGIAYDDPDVGIDWPDLRLTVSQRDRAAPRLADVQQSLPFVYQTA
jgi:dTDP-4-dehydrorhamnose 3,5-epimerase